MFRQVKPNIIKSANAVVMQVKEFSIRPNNHKMRCYIMQNRPNPGCLGIFSAAAWNEVTGKGGLGFVMLDSNGVVCCAGMAPCAFTGRLEIGFLAISLALHQCIVARNRCSHIYINSDDIWKAILHTDDLIHWRQKDAFDSLKAKLNILNNPKIDLIPHHWNRIATALAAHGINSAHLSLFHLGMERPFWLMKLINQSGFSY